MIDVLSPCVTFNDHEGSTKSYAYVKDHDEPLSEVGFVPYFEEIKVEYDPGTTTAVTLHNGSKIVLTKMTEDYHPTDKGKAMQMLHETSRRGEYATGVLYIEPDKQSFVDMYRPTWARTLRRRATRHPATTMTGAGVASPCREVALVLCCRSF